MVRIIFTFLYNNLTSPSEQPWTKELTDYLFELYREYDGRWYIIWDRAEFPVECKFDIDVSFYISVQRLTIEVESIRI